MTDISFLSLVVTRILQGYDKLPKDMPDMVI